MQEILNELQGIMGIDTNNQIINIWYELKFQNAILNHIVGANKHLVDCLDKEAIDGCRIKAQEEIRKKFPNLPLTFSKVE